MNRFGKGLSNGFPISAVLASRAASVFEPGDHGGTFNGSALACAAALATLEILTTPAFLAGVIVSGDRFGMELERVSKAFSCSADIDTGHMRRLSLPLPVAGEIVRSAMLLASTSVKQRIGLMVNSPRPSILRFLLALNTTESEIEEMCVKLTTSIDAALNQKIGGDTSCLVPLVNTVANGNFSKKIQGTKTPATVSKFDTIDRSTDGDV